VGYLGVTRNWGARKRWSVFSFGPRETWWSGGVVEWWSGGGRTPRKHAKVPRPPPILSTIKNLTLLYAIWYASENGDK
jgi:hypothetical protein